MPRDSSGFYTLPPGNPVIDGTVIETTWANPTMSDIAAQLNNVLTRDGLLGPIMPILGVNGSALLPSYAFAGDPDIGMFRSGTNALGFSAGGVERLTVNTTGVSVTGNLNVSGDIAGNPTFSGQLKLADGTVALPSLTFTSDPDNGIYRPGPNIFAIAMNGVESARFGSGSLSIKTTIATTALVVDAQAGLSTAPAPAAGTVAMFLRNQTTNSNAFITLISGNAANSGVNFGDTDADARGFVHYDHVNDVLTFSSINQRFRHVPVVTAPTVVAQNMSGWELLGGGMNATNKYTGALKFGSTDSDFTTVNPKFGAIIAGYATETYSSDLAGGMGMEFFTQDNAPGAAGNLVSAMKINQAQRVVVGPSGYIDNPVYLGSAVVPLFGVGGGSGVGMSVASWHATGPSPRMSFFSSTGALPAHGIVASGDQLGLFTFAGSDGTQYVRAALISIEVDGTTGVNDMPGRIRFYTTPDGTSAPEEAVRISNTKSVTFFTPVAGSTPHVINMNANEVGTQWTDGTRTFQVRELASQFQIGSSTSTVINLMTNNTNRFQISNTIFDFLQASGCLRINGDITRFESAEGAVTALGGAGAQTVAVSHGGPRTPDAFVTVLRCKTAEQGWAVNDEVCPNSDIDGATTTGSVAFANVTQVGTMWNATSAGGPQLRNKTTGAVFRITVANWRWVHKCLWL